MIKRSLRMFFALVVLGLAACRPLASPTPTPADAIADLLAVLEAQGLSVERTDNTVQQPFLTPIGFILRVEDEDLQVFVYEDEAALEREAANIGPDGSEVISIDGAPMIIDWIAPVHVYVRGRLWMIFVSDNEAVAGKIAAVADRVLVGEAPLAVQIARGVLAQQFRIGRPYADLVFYERVDWADGCLEVRQPGQFCTEVIVPGYRVILEANEQRYEMRTDLEGQQVVSADAPEVMIEEPVLVWQRELDNVEIGPNGCRTVVLDAEGNAVFGACVGARLMAPLLPETQRNQQLTYFLDRYASFQAETPAGRIELVGRGEVQATPAEQRAITHWATLVHQELMFGRSGASWGLAFSLNSEEKILCGMTSVEIYGLVYAYECNRYRPYEPSWLSPEELEQLYAWMDEFQGFELLFREDGARMRFVMGGFGRKPATEAQKRAILDWARALHPSVAGA